MTETSPMPAPGPRRRGPRLRGVIATLILIALVYSGLWYLAAHQMETRLATLLSSDRLGVGCRDMTVGGYPLRLTVACSMVTVDNRERGTSASLGAIDARAPVYNPGRIDATLSGPAEFRMAPDLVASSRWTAADLSLRTGLSGISNATLSATGLQGSITASAGITPSLHFTLAEGASTVTRDGTVLTSAMQLKGLALLTPEDTAILPPFDATLNASLTAQEPIQLGRGSRLPLRGSQGQLDGLTVDFGNGLTGKASGPFNIDEEGLLSGEFDLSIDNVDGWRDAVIAAFPQTRSMARNVAGMLRALSGNRDQAHVKLNVRKGTAFLAFIPVGVLPRF
ncbi:hypothetical protein BTR14_16485 [Rhizobium rhizosphaerae]|uniref:DUF2125 domain-containing protein n=1 Tax=Xaviernesmea rhizosphaerae TaxID=1672749 RepID=A0ABX3PBF8_9HYPH|nr:hypothetical protein BTR14_16485 [Xaviernesmea rhizosphaerae]